MGQADRGRLGATDAHTMRLRRRSKAVHDVVNTVGADHLDVVEGGASSHGDHHQNSEEVQESRRVSRHTGQIAPLRWLLDVRTAGSPEELEHDAALELQESMAPAMEQLLLNVPGSTSYEEASTALARQAAIELDKPVTVPPEAVIDLRNPPEMGAYPENEKLSNRVLRLTNRHWAEGRPRPPADIMAEKEAIAEKEWDRRPIGTARCAAFHGALRCSGVFAYGKDDRGSIVGCPTCGAAHRFDDSTSTWVLTGRREVARQASIGRGG